MTAKGRCLQRSGTVLGVPMTQRRIALAVAAVVASFAFVGSFGSLPAVAVSYDRSH